MKLRFILKASCKDKARHSPTVIFEKTVEYPKGNRYTQSHSYNPFWEAMVEINRMIAIHNR